MEIHILLAGVEIGPFSEKQVRQYLEDGLVSPSDPAKVASMEKWEAVDIVLANLPPPAPPATAPPSPPVQGLVRAILKVPSLSPATPNPAPPTPAPAPSEAPAPKDSAFPATTQKIKRKPSKIVLQPMLPIETSRLPEARPQAIIQAISSPSDSQSPASPPTSAASAPRKMIAVKAILPAQPQSTSTTEKGLDKKAPPPLPKVNPGPADAPLRVPPLAQKQKRSFVPHVRGVQPKTLYFVVVAGVVIILIGSFIYWEIYGSGNQAKPDTASNSTPEDADDAILASHPTTADGYIKRGTVRQAKNDVEGALADYDQAITLEPDNVQAFYQRGLAREAKNDWSGALADLNQALNLDPRHAESYSNRGFVKQTQGDLDGAISDYTQALYINPKIAVAYYNRGLIKGQRGDLDGAIADYTQALEINPKIALVYYNRGLLRAQKGEFDAAILDFNHTIDLDPAMATAFFNRGNAKNTEGNIDGAIADYTQALQLNPKIAAAYGYRGSARQTKGDLNGALDDYSQAITLNPKLASIYYNRSLIKEQKGDLDGAIADTTQALALNPKDAQSYCNRGLAKLGKGDLDGALVDLKTFCQLAPQDNDADYARLYLWLISTRENPQGHADKDLSTALTASWNSTPESLASKIAKFLLGHASEADMLGIANDMTQDPETRCKTWYFTGMKRLLAGQKAVAADYFQKALSTGKPDCCEYMFAQQELKDLVPAPQPAAGP